MGAAPADFEASSHVSGLLLVLHDRPSAARCAQPITERSRPKVYIMSLYVYDLYIIYKQ